MILADLLDALAAAPALQGARCRGRHGMFDPPTADEDTAATEARHRQALALCGRCPALARCGEWLDALPPRDRPPGVVAGRVIADPKPRRQRTAAA